MLARGVGRKYVKIHQNSHNPPIVSRCRMATGPALHHCTWCLWNGEARVSQLENFGEGSPMQVEMVCNPNLRPGVSGGPLSKIIPWDTPWARTQVLRNVYVSFIFETWKKQDGIQFPFFDSCEACGNATAANVRVRNRCLFSSRSFSAVHGHVRLKNLAWSPFCTMLRCSPLRIVCSTRECSWS